MPFVEPITIKAPQQNKRYNAISGHLLFFVTVPNG